MRLGPPAGLCGSCRHRHLVRNTRGSTFSLCRRASWDATLAKYPPLPVLACHGHAAMPPAPVPASAPGRADG